VGSGWFPLFKDKKAKGIGGMDCMDCIAGMYYKGGFKMLSPSKIRLALIGVPFNTPGKTPKSCGRKLHATAFNHNLS
jgi:hypothetical protein